LPGAHHNSGRRVGVRPDQCHCMGPPVAWCRRRHRREQTCLEYAGAGTAVASAEWVSVRGWNE
jgi:hypothetical protein